jgi:transcriptional regulator with PAS, ATPase and Fis domain
VKKEEISQGREDENPLIKSSLKEVHKEAVRKAEREFIYRALEQTNWNRKKAAEILSISYKSLLYKIKEGNLQ